MGTTTQKIKKKIENAFRARFHKVMATREPVWKNEKSYQWIDEPNFHSCFKIGKNVFPES